jgi:hypothetical protein
MGWVGLRNGVAARAGVPVDPRVAVPPWLTRVKRWLTTSYGCGITIAAVFAIPTLAMTKHGHAWLGLVIPILVANLFLVPSFYGLDAKQRDARWVWIVGAVVTAALIIAIAALGGLASAALATAAVAATAFADEHMYKRAREG